VQELLGAARNDAKAAVGVMIIGGAPKLTQSEKLQLEML
jgi:hypothetical protein